MKNTYFLSYKDYLEKKYGQSAFRIGVDGGFSCPNRGIDRLHSGCTFCAEEGARSPYTTKGTTLEDQISLGKEFLRQRYNAEIFLLYFQAFSSTFDTPDNLQRIYDRGLACGTFRELIVSTRPDCVTKEIADVLSSYIRPDFDVWVELGLQSSCSRTLERIRRGHSPRDYEVSARLLRDRGIKIGTHVIYGLPGEGPREFQETIQFAKDIGLEGIKFHNLLIPPGTPMYKEWEEGKVSQPSMLDYRDGVIQALEILPNDVVILRLSTDFPGAESDLPGEVWPKNRFFNQVVQEMSRRGTFQGAKA